MYLEEKVEPTALPLCDKPKREQWQEDCLAAADYMDKYGWCQGHDWMEDGRSCIRGAMYLANGKDVTRWQTAMWHLVSKIGNAVSFNDAPGRTKEEVTAALRLHGGAHVS